MAIKWTLRRELVYVFVGISIAIVATYSALLPWYFSTGASQAASLILELEARSYEQRYTSNPSTPLPTSSTLTSYLGIHTLPRTVLEKFPEETHAHRELIVVDTIDPTGEEKILILFPYDLPDGKRLFLFQELSLADDPELLEAPAQRLIYLFWIVGLICLGLLICVAVLMWRRIAVRVNTLNMWTRTLNLDNYTDTTPDFRFEELNELSDHLQSAFRRIAEVVEREKDFLNNASHELRTPVAVIGATVQLLEKRGTTGSPDDLALGRIKRSAKSMEQLIETLLWLSREEQNRPPIVPVSLNHVVTSLLEEYDYLITGKNVEVRYEPTTVCVHTAETPCWIAIGNLIRNAFQYTHNGYIEIFINPDEVKISNRSTISDDAMHGSEGHEGHGLGLLLVEKIAQRMGWSLELEFLQNEGVDATLRIS